MALTAPRLRVDIRSGVPIEDLLRAAQKVARYRQVIVEFEYGNAIVRVGNSTNLAALKQLLPEEGSTLAGPMRGMAYGETLDHSVDLPDAHGFPKS